MACAFQHEPGRLKRSQGEKKICEVGDGPGAEVNMSRIAVAGFQHETNSFSPIMADWEAFRRTTSWPGLTIGNDVEPVVEGMNLAIAGFLAAARTKHRIVPIVWANATPSGPVTDDAFERIMAIIVSGLRDVDAVFLDLHGAMVTQTYLDGESEILRRVRLAVGPTIPIVASLDLHANVSPEMVVGADALIGCRTYPHIDLAETGARAYAAVATLLSSGRRLTRAFRQGEFLIPIQAQTTHLQPAARLYRDVMRLEAEHKLLALSLTLGFGPSDTPHCGPAIAGFGLGDADVERVVVELTELVSMAEKEFKQPTFSPRDAVQRAIAVARPGRPVVLADLQDNPGAGGTGDTTGLLAALVDAKAEGSILAVLFDPEAAAAAHAVGEGACLELSLGGRRGGPGSVPIFTGAKVERLGSGQFRGTGPMYGGATMDLGPMALLTLPSGPQVIVGSVNTHSADQSILRHLDIEPREQRIIALKSAVHFRADFEPIASEIIVVEAPGSNFANHNAFPYRHLRSNVRLMPQ
jgi:microcystin degradation protein MlrC